jgi:hypothetical protein
MRPTQRLAAALAIGGLLTAACGARLTPAQRTAALSQNGGSTGSGTTGAGTTGAGTTGAGTTGSGTSGTTGGSGTTGTGTTGAGSTTGTSGSGTSGSTGTGGSTTGASGDFTKAPAGGNGGKTDVGITATSITIANISDVSGAVPGLFEDARFATQAYVKYFNARYGALYGRKIILKTYDSQLDAGAARAKTIEACDVAFAGVGSVSAFDQGAAEPTRSCGIPDLRGLSTTDQMKAVPSAYPINSAGTGGKRSMAVFGWVKDKFPKEVRENAAYIYIDGDVTRQLEQQDAEGSAAMLGFKWKVETAIGITETNYASVVRDLKDKSIRYVTFVGAYQQAARLAKEFVTQGFKPDVFQPTVTAYTPNFIKQTGSAAEGVYVAVAPSLNEEISNNPELQLYAQWLNQVKPGATPTAIGQYSWGAAALFFQKMIELGPKPTRKGLLALMPKIRSYDGNGLFPANDVGGRELTDCTSVVQIKNGRFVRIEPAAPGTVRCKDGVWNTKTKKAEAGYPK